MSESKSFMICEKKSQVLTLLTEIEELAGEQETDVFVSEIMTIRG